MPGTKGSTIPNDRTQRRRTRHAERSAEENGPREARALWLALCLLFSGAASLALEVVWMRELRLAFGSTTLASSTILVAYMLGLGAGAWLGGNIARRVQRPLRLYAGLEMIVGLSALAVPVLSRTAAEILSRWLVETHFWAAASVKFLASQAIFLVPTLAMGATLPLVVSAASSGVGRVGRTTAILYAANTAGAVIGVFAATFFLLPRLGLSGANATAALTDLLLGIAVLLWDRRSGAELEANVRGFSEPARTRAAPFASRHELWPLLCAYGAIGFAALALEVCWTRALSGVFGSSSFAFGAMLGSFLLGIALGSWLLRRRVETLRSPGYVASLLVLVLSLVSLSTSKLLFLLPGWFPWVFLYLGATYAAAIASSIGLALVALLPPTTVFGALFPLLVTLVARAGKDAAWSVSRAYLWNTLGSALGAFAGGFLLLPGLGLQGSLQFLTVLTAGVAVLLALWQQERAGASRAALLLAALAVAAWTWFVGPRIEPEALTRGVYRFPLAELDVGVAPVGLRGPLEGQILFYRDGWNATVSVHRVLGELSLRVNGKADASTRGDLPTQVLMGHLGYFFRPGANDVAIVGLASGITAGSATLYGANRIHVLEIEPAMVAASHLFDEVNRRPLEHPAVRLIVDDARAYLAGQERAYDLILSEPSNPWMAGSANLFTREFFSIARRALRPRGLLVQWLQLYAMPPEAVAAVLRALTEVFPHVYAFAPGHGDNDLLLVAGSEPIDPGAFPRWEALPAEARGDLVRAGVFDDVDVRALLYLTPRAVRELAAHASAANTDDNMLVELSGPRALYGEPTAPANWQQVDAYARELADFWLGATLDSDQMLGELALAYLRRGAKAQANALAEKAQAGASAVLARATRAQVALLEHELDSEALDRFATELTQVVSAVPNSYSARYLLAQAESDAQNHSRALSQVEEGLRQRPGDLRLRRLRLRALLALGRASEAWQEAEALLATPLKQRDIDLYWDAAQAAAQSGHVSRAIQLAETYLDYHPDSPQQWNFLAEQYALSGQQEAAARARDHAEQAKRNMVLSLHMQARRAALAGDRHGALEMLRTVLLFDPSYRPARNDVERLEGDGNLSW